MLKSFLTLCLLTFVTLSSCDVDSSTKTTPEPFDEGSAKLSLTTILDGEKFFNTLFKIEKNSLNFAYAERFTSGSRQKTKIYVGSGSNSFEFIIDGDKVGEYYFTTDIGGVNASFRTYLDYETKKFSGDDYSGKVIIDTYDLSKKKIEGRFFGTFSTYPWLEIEAKEGKFFIDKIN